MMTPVTTRFFGAMRFSAALFSLISILLLSQLGEVSAFTKKKSDLRNRRIYLKSSTGKTTRQDPAAENAENAGAAAAENNAAGDIVTDVKKAEEDAAADTTPTTNSSNAGGDEQEDEYVLDEYGYPCCVYERFDRKGLSGKNLARPQETLEDAQELCDANDLCLGVVRLAMNSSKYPGQYALKGGDEEESNATTLYTKGSCEEKVKCPRGEPNITTTNTTDVNATIVSGCVTKQDPRASAWFATTAPSGTPCTFGADPRDEAAHCIHEDNEFGTFGWCFTKLDKSEWGSCDEGCPLIGHNKVLGDQLNEIAGAIQEMNGLLREHFDLGNASATANANSGTVPTATAGGAAEAAPAAAAGGGGLNGAFKDQPPVAKAPPKSAKAETKTSALLLSKKLMKKSDSSSTKKLIKKQPRRMVKTRKMQTKRQRKGSRHTW